MEFRMTKNEVDSAITTGLKMLSAEDVNTPNAWNIDLGNLQKVLALIAGGQLKLIPVETAAPIQDEGDDKQ